MEQVAVLLPVYEGDNPEWFRLALDSVLNQRGCESRVFIGVDGPIGNFLREVIDEYRINSFVEIIEFPVNRGLACVLNDLLREVRGRHYAYIARMDADDISLPHRFETQISYLETHPDIDVVGCDIEEIDENSKSRGKIVSYPKDPIECFKHFRYRDPLAHPAVMFRDTFFNKVKGYREEFRKNQDTMLWYDGFLNHCGFSNVAEILLQFRITEDFYSRRNGIKRAKQMLFTRIRINKSLNYDLSANVFAIMMFLMTISPKCIKKILYRIRS
ncbi:MAG: glycosyltransferase [Muribaculaceae bacterium]|nr:glycosyltransferase [Muribaculaceae bacterium]